jgi:hypothetical protein
MDESMNTQAVTEQAPAPSVEERAAAALFGAPKQKAAPAAPPAPALTETEEGTAPEIAELPEGTEATSEESPAPETFEFEHEGEKWTLPKKLEKAIQNNRDYTQKSQEIANQRRALEVLNEQAKTMNMTREFESSVAAEMQQLAAYDQVLSQPMDTNLGEADLLRSMVQRNQWKEQREAIARSVNGKHQQYMQNYDKAVGELKAKALDAVSKRVPGWNDALWTQIRDHAKTDGYTDSELSSISDPRHQITLWKAQQYDQLKAKATKAVTDVKAVKTTPSNPMSQQTKDKLAFNKMLKGTAPGSFERKQAVEARAASIFEKR